MLVVLRRECRVCVIVTSLPKAHRLEFPFRRNYVMAAVAGSTEGSQMTPWLKSKLEPKTTGELNVSVRFRSGQVSTFKVNSSMTVGDFKSRIAAEAILDVLESTPAKSAELPLLYLGKTLGDGEALETYKIADGACLIQAPAIKEPTDSIDAFKEATVRDMQESKSTRYPTHTSLLYERIKHNPARGLDLDYDLPSWHLDYKPYTQYVPPKDGKPQFQAAAYEADGAQAFRRDYYTSGPGNQTEINKEYHARGH